MANQEQIEYWNGVVGEKWRNLHLATEAMLRPFTLALLESIENLSGKSILDIGCGTGETTIIAAQSAQSVVGIDVSKPLLQTAIERKDLGSNFAKFVEADASTYRFDGEFDLMISRFGVMFFDDPFSAFENLANALKLNGKIKFVCWQPPQNNEWVYLPIGALEGLNEPIVFNTQAPGPFAFSEQSKVEAILANAGFKDITFEGIKAPMQITLNGGVDAAIDYLTKIGPASRTIAALDPNEKDIAITRLRALIAPKMAGTSLFLEGAVWLINAQKSN